jgi:hypothetical protein
MPVRYGKTRGRRSSSILNTTFRGIDKAGSGLITWAVTDHTGISKRLLAMPSGMGIIASLRYTFRCFVWSIASTIVGTVTMIAGYIVLFWVACWLVQYL